MQTQSRHCIIIHSVCRLHFSLVTMAITMSHWLMTWTFASSSQRDFYSSHMSYNTAEILCCVGVTNSAIFVCNSPVTLFVLEYKYSVAGMMKKYKEIWLPWLKSLQCNICTLINHRSQAVCNKWVEAAQIVIIITKDTQNYSRQDNKCNFLFHCYADI